VGKDQRRRHRAGRDDAEQPKHPGTSEGCHLSKAAP
jgi:hypothetical protein